MSYESWDGACLPVVAPRTGKIIKNGLSVFDFEREENFLQNGILNIDYSI